MFGKLDLPNGVRLRMTRAGDREMERVIHDASRQDLQLIDGEPDFVRSVFDMQLNARDTGYGAMFPNALYFMIEMKGESVGRLVMDIGQGRVHIVDITLIPQWHNRGIGTIVITAMQKVAATLPAEVGLSVRRNNPAAMALYTKLGFVPEVTADPLSMDIPMRWRPGAVDVIQNFGAGTR